jgi:hypothetical protein
MNEEEEEEEQLEWEACLYENLQSLLKSTDADAKTLVIDGAFVRPQKGLVMVIGNCTFLDYSSTEIHDVTNGSVHEGPDMKIDRQDHALATLPNGDIAVFGGFHYAIKHSYISACEVFEVANNSFRTTNHLIERRCESAAVSLRDGRVMVIGGCYRYTWLNSCEFYNPSSRKFTACRAKMRVTRTGHTASLLPDGTVLVCGGYSSDKSVFQTTEIYDPSTDSFSDGPLMDVVRGRHTATTLMDGRIILTGGEHNKSSNSTAMYNPTTKSFSAGPDMIASRRSHFAALLPDGRVLVGGGFPDESYHSTEIYDPWRNSFTKGTDLMDGRKYAAAALY